jgi:predicted PurR-regulated permease PerM
VVSARAYRLLFWLGFLLLVIVVLGLVQSILLPFATGFVIAYVLAPIVAHLDRRGVPRSLGSLLVLILFLVGFAGILVVLVPLIQGQIVELITRVPSLVRALQDQLGKLILLLQEHLPAEDVTKLRDMVGSKLGEAVTWIAGLVQGMITSSFAILNIVSLVVVTPIVTFFLLRDWDAMVAQVDSYLPRQSLETVRGQARIVSDTLVGFIHGQALVCLILAVYYGIALTAAGLQSGLALGLLIGVLAIIPILGSATGFTLALGLAALQYGSWTAILVVIGIFAFGQLVEGNLLTPKLVGDRIHLHPVWVIFALFAGGTLYGFVGVLLAVPAAAVIGVLIRFALSRYRGSTLYDAREREPPSREPPSRVAPFR